MTGQSTLSILVIICASFILHGCLAMEEPDDPNQFILTLTLPETADWQRTGEDSIRVLSYKMVIDSLELIRPDDNEVFAPQPLFASHSHGTIQDETVISAGTIRGGDYNGIKYSLRRPDSDTQLQDQDLVVRNEIGEVTDTYSFAVSGIYNGDGFRFRSKATPNVEYGFQETLSMPENLGTMRVQMRANWKQWFYNFQDDEIINPNNPDNRAEIEERIVTYFDTQLFTVGEVVN